MTVIEIEDLAYRGEELPRELNYPETLLFMMFRSLYEFARWSKMNREQGKREKQRILRLYENERRIRDFDEKLTACHVKLIKDSELAKTACRKNPTPENALRLCDILDGLLRLPEEPGQNVQTFGNLNARTRAGPGCADT